MAGRPITKIANIENIQKLLATDLVDIRPIITVVMRECGCTFEEIGKVFGFTRQNAEILFKNTKDKL